MAIKIKHRTPRRHRNPNVAPIVGDDDYIEVGHGTFCVLTIPHNGGPTVVHRFPTQAEAEAQLQKNIAADRPLVDFDKMCA